MSAEPIDIQAAADKLPKHWLVVLAGGAIAVSSFTWGVSNNTQVKPRDEQIVVLEKQVEDLKKQVEDLKKAVGTLNSELDNVPKLPPPDPIVLPETRVYNGYSVTTKDGMCEIALLNTYTSSEGLSASFLVTVVTDGSEKFEYVKPGHVISMSGYYVHVHAVFPGGVDLAVSKPPK